MSTPNLAAKVGGIVRADFHAVTASADLDTRVIAGVIVPYGQVGATSWGRLIVESGAVTLHERVILNADHDPSRPVGLLVEHEDTDEGLRGSFKLGNTPKADEVLLEASEGLRPGLSVELQVDDYSFDEELNAIRVRAGRLYAVGSVSVPAFDDALVEHVAATHTRAPSTEQDTPMLTLDDVKAAISEAMTAQSTPPAPAALPAAHTQDRFPYGPGVSASFFRDMFHASNDADAAERVRTAQAMMSAAQTSEDIAAIIPTKYRPDMYVGQLTTPRPIIDAFAREDLDGPTPLRVPKFVSASGMLSTHTEGTNPASGEISVTDALMTPVPKSGIYDATREMVEGATPAVDAIILTAIYESYAVQSEAYVQSVFLDEATNGDVVAKTIDLRKRLVTFASARLRSANATLAGEDVFDMLIGETDTTGRPMNPEYGPVNATGVSNDLMSVVVGARAFTLKPAMDGALIGVATDAYSFESGLRTWRWEEVGGPANIRFAAFGYVGAHVLRPAGLLHVELDS